MATGEIRGQGLGERIGIDLPLIKARKVPTEEFPLYCPAAGVSVSMECEQHTLHQHVALAVH